MYNILIFPLLIFSLSAAQRPRLFRRPSLSTLTLCLFGRVRILRTRRRLDRRRSAKEYLHLYTARWCKQLCSLRRLARRVFSQTLLCPRSTLGVKDSNRFCSVRWWRRDSLVKPNRIPLRRRLRWIRKLAFATISSLRTNYYCCRCSFSSSSYQPRRTFGIPSYVFRRAEEKRVRFDRRRRRRKSYKRLLFC